MVIETDNILVEKANLILMVTRKAGNTSIKRAMVQSELISGVEELKTGIFTGFNHLSPKEVYESDAVKILVMRHPAARIFSCWNHKIMNPGKADLIQTHGFEKGMSWAKFLTAVTKIPDDKADPHLRSQTFMRCYKGLFLPEEVLKIEEASKWWPRIADLLKIKLDALPHENASGTPNWMEYMTESQKDSVKIRYSADLQLGGYSMK